MRMILLTALIAAQVAPPSGVIITIDAIVSDRSGKPIAGLSPSDFAVELDGRAASVRSITYLANGVPMSGAVGPSFDAVTPGTPPVYRLVVIAPDGAEPDKEFRVVVTVNRPEAKVQADPRVRALAPARAAPANPAAPSADRTSPTPKLTRMGPLVASELLRWVLDPSGKPQALPAPDLPLGASSVIVTLELRPVAAPPADVLVKIALMSGENQEILIERVVTPELH